MLRDVGTCIYIYHELELDSSTSLLVEALLKSKQNDLIIQQSPGHNGFASKEKLLILSMVSHLPAFLNNSWETLVVHSLIETQGDQEAAYPLATFLGLTLSQYSGNFPSIIWLLLCIRSLSHSAGNNSWYTW